MIEKNDLNILMNSDWKKTKNNIIKRILSKKNYSSIMNDPVFCSFFKTLANNFNNKINFKDDSHRKNYLQKPFRQEKNKPLNNLNEELDQNFWKVPRKYWSEYKRNAIKKDLNDKSTKRKSIFDYYGNIHTMVNLVKKERIKKQNEKEIKEEKEKNFDFNQNFIDRHLYNSFNDPNNNILDLLIRQDNNFINKNKLKTYVYSNNKSGNPLNIEQLIALNLSHKNKILNIKGPPGTGKTTLLKDLVVSLCLNNKKMFIASSNNQAVDNILNSFNEDNILKDLPMIRMGNLKKIQETYDNIFKENIKEKPPRKPKYVNSPLDVSMHIDDLKKISFNNETLNESFLFFQGLINFTKESEIIKKIKKPIKKIIFLKKQINKLKIIIQKNIDLKNKKKHWFFLINIINKWIFKKRNNHIINFDISPFKFIYTNNKNIINDLNNILTNLEFMLKNQKSKNQKNIDEIKKTIVNSTKITQKNIKKYNYQYMLKKHKTISLITKEINDMKNVYANININISKVSKDDDGNEIDCTNGNLLKKIFKNGIINGKSISDSFPIIFSTTLSIPGIVSENEKIDYLIVDEAAQTTIHSILGISKYFKNIILLGDTSQLAAVTPLNNEKEEEIFKYSNIPNVYRNIDNSISKIIENVLPSNLTILLKDHWRCKPTIANFFNKYYDYQLNIMRSDNINKEDMVYEVYEGNFSDKLIKLEETYKDQIQKDKQTIALMSPYKEVKWINSPIEKKGTTHKFQGYENDTIIYYIENKILKEVNIKNFLNDEKLFNVAVSRAKNKFHLLIGDQTLKSLRKNDKNKDNELTLLIEYINNLQKPNFELANLKSKIDIWSKKKALIKIEEENNSFFAKVDKRIFELVKESNLFITFGVRDIDVNNDIKHIDESKEIFDIVIYDKHGSIHMIINQSKIIYVSSQSRDKIFDLEFDIKIKYVKKLLSEREVFWRNKIDKSFTDGKMILSNVSLKKILNNNEYKNKMHFDFVFADYYEKDGYYYFEYKFIMELDDATHLKKSSIQLDILKNQICSKNNIKLIRFKI